MIASLWVSTEPATASIAAARLVSTSRLRAITAHGSPSRRASPRCGHRSGRANHLRISTVAPAVSARTHRRGIPQAMHQVTIDAECHLMHYLFQDGEAPSLDFVVQQYTA